MFKIENQSCIKQLADKNQIHECRSNILSNEIAFEELSNLDDIKNIYKIKFQNCL